jgi:hypothetical protein
MPGFQARLIYQSKKRWEESLNLRTITNSTVRREQVGAAFRQTADVRLGARYHAIVLLRDGRNGPEVARWLY